ncbi:hypothetical protein TNCV_782381 [Trichonephila clavipes]|nr:hypothetical protein TNCV_782381 [Trichonephila clavipes]
MACVPLMARDPIFWARQRSKRKDVDAVAKVQCVLWLKNLNQSRVYRDEFEKNGTPIIDIKIYPPNGKELMNSALWLWTRDQCVMSSRPNATEDPPCKGANVR